MQINSSTGVASAPLTSTKAVGASMDIGAADAAEKEKAKKAGPLFVGGLVNWSNMLSPDTMKAMFELNEDGSVKSTANGTPIGAGNHNVPQDTAAQRFIFDHFHVAAMEKLGLEKDLTPHVTDEQKQFFHDVTGYNLVVEGLYGVYDDEGNPVSNGVDPKTGGQDNAVWQLADSIVSNQQPSGAQVPIDSKWFENWQSTMTSAGVEIPKDWATKAKAHFDEALDALFNRDKDRETARVDAQNATNDAKPTVGAQKLVAGDIEEPPATAVQ